jgi:hypothetical protein
MIPFPVVGLRGRAQGGNELVGNRADADLAPGTDDDAVLSEHPGHAVKAGAGYSKLCCQGGAWTAAATAGECRDDIDCGVDAVALPTSHIVSSYDTARKKTRRKTM